MYGPTNFAPIINHMAQIAAQYQHSGDHYYVLVIITDGIITDMPNTKEVVIDDLIVIDLMRNGFELT